MKKTIYAIIVFSLSILIIIILYGESSKLNRHKNGFLRRFNFNMIHLDGAFDLKYNSFYIAGSTFHKIYLANYNATSHLLIINYNFTEIQHIVLNSPDTTKIAWLIVKIIVDSPHIYAMEGMTPTILHSQLPYLNTKRLDLNNDYFSASLPISTSSFILRVFDNSLQQYILVKKILYSPTLNRTLDGILEKQIDGRFSLDGTLSYETNAHHLFYMYYYHNQFLCLDTNLKLIYKGKTIDTFSIAKVQVARIASENKITMSAPPVLINKKSCLGDNYIFINSNLLGDNENRKIFNESSVIDVYKINDGSYQFSFYIPEYMGTKMTDFKVSNNKLIVLFDHFICVYNLNL